MKSLWLALLVLFGGCAPPVAAPPLPDPPRAAATELPAPPREDINARFLAPDLDIAEYTRVFEGESRDIAHQREAIADALALRPGMAVADVGAGTGLFLEPFARRVGAAGRLYAVELSPRFREHLAARARAAGLAQVEVVEATPTSSRLAPGSVDVAFVCDTYHHFDAPQPTLASLFAALRPDGALVIVDFERIPGRTPEWILEHVRAGKEEVIREIEAAGFRLERELAIAGLRENYVLRFRRP